MTYYAGIHGSVPCGDVGALGVAQRAASYTTGWDTNFCGRSSQSVRMTVLRIVRLLVDGLAVR